MAINPGISLATASPTLSPAINAFENAMMNSQTRAARQQQMAIAEEKQGQVREQRRITNTALTAINSRGMLVEAIETGDSAPLKTWFTRNLTDIQQRQGGGEEIDANETLEALKDIDDGNLQGLLQKGDIITSNARNLGYLGGNQGQSAGTREFNNLLRVAQDPNATELERNSAKRALGGLERVTTSATERIATDTGLGEKVVAQKGAEANATESAKLTQQREFKPAIARAIKLAEASAAEQGTVLTDLQRSVAGMPGLIEATDKLKELAMISTSTFGGRVWDLAVKESGFGSTKGSNAKIKYKAIIDNQVLPLLKQTFGGAMTEGEGLRLSNTLGDPGASPEQKLLQTEAFMEHQQRQMETLKRQADAGTVQGEAAPQVLNFDAQGNLIQ